MVLSHSWLTTEFVARATRWVALVEQQLFTLPVFIGVRVVRSLGFYLMFCRLLFSFCSFLLVIPLPVRLQFKTSNYSFCIFKLVFKRAINRNRLFMWETRYVYVIWMWIDWYRKYQPAEPEYEVYWRVSEANESQTSYSVEQADIFQNQSYSHLDDILIILISTINTDTSILVFSREKLHDSKYSKYASLKP